MRAEPQERIDRKALKVWRTTGCIAAFFYWQIPLVYGFIAVKFSLPMWILTVLSIFALSLTIFEVLIHPKILWREWRYEISEHEIELKYGVFVIRRVLIPMIRVQHVDTKQGPILRRYGLAAVTVSTAAGNHEIPALALNQADEVRNRIADLAKMADNDV